MKDTKRLALRFFLAAELVVVTFFYLFSSGGLQALRREDVLDRELLADVARLEAEIGLLYKELEERKNPYYKESIARKELQMAYDTETIYLLPKKG